MVLGKKSSPWGTSAASAKYIARSVMLNTGSPLRVTSTRASKPMGSSTMSITPFSTHWLYSRLAIWRGSATMSGVSGPTPAQNALTAGAASIDDTSRGGRPYLRTSRSPTAVVKRSWSGEAKTWIAGRLPTGAALSANTGPAGAIRSPAQISPAAEINLKLNTPNLPLRIGNHR